MKFIALVAAMIIPAMVEAATTCSVSEARGAEQATDTMTSWPAIYSGFKRYAHCDDASIAEGFDDKVVHLLASQWPSLEAAAQFTTKDEKFRTFVLRHISATADTDELKTIAALSEAQCPSELAALCKDIHSAAVAAVEESSK